MSAWWRNGLQAAINYRHTRQARRHARYTGLGYGFGLAFAVLILGVAVLLGVTP